MSNTATPRAGCFEAMYPSMAWEQTTCGAPLVGHEAAPAPSTVGNGNDFVAQSSGYPGNAPFIAKAVGSFPSVTGLTSETDVCVAPFLSDCGGASGGQGANAYSLQENAEIGFPVTFNGWTGTGWQQFIFDNAPSDGFSGCTNGCVWIEYWLLNYYSENSHKCPGTVSQNPTDGGPWFESGNDCVWNTATTVTPYEAPTSLSSLSLEAFANLGGQDEAELCVAGGMCYTKSEPDNVLNLYQQWGLAEFNVFGYIDGSQAQFNSGTTITVVNTLTDSSGSAIAPVSPCPNNGQTGETNNLNLGSCSANNSSGQISFAESNAPSVSTTTSTATSSATTSTTTSTTNTFLTTTTTTSISTSTIGQLCTTTSSTETTSTTIVAPSTTTTTTQTTTQTTTGTSTFFTTASSTSTSTTITTTTVTTCTRTTTSTSTSTTSTTSTAASSSTAPAAWFGQISSVVSAGAGSVWFVLPDFTAGEAGSMHTSASKCGGHVAALATDVYAATYLFGALAAPQQNEVLDTNSAYVSQSISSCGEPTTPIDQPLVAVAGSAVNEVVGYYETVQATSPLYYGTSGSQAGCIVRRDTGASVDCSTPTATNDVFIMEAFTDQAGRTVYIIYGRQWGGTLAGFEYLVNFVLRNPSTYTASWYVYRWQDATTGPSANGIPDPGDTYTLIAYG